MFSEDQLVVYPSQGVGKIECLKQQEIGGLIANFYIIRILSTNITVMVPVNNADNVGLRKLCTQKQASKVLEDLQDRTTFSGYTGQNWNRRYREYSEKLKSPSLIDVCNVLKELILISAEKELSFGERRLLEQAMGLVTSELSCVLDKTPAELREMIDAYYADILQREEKTS